MCLRLRGAVSESLAELEVRIRATGIRRWTKCLTSTSWPEPMPIRNRRTGEKIFGAVVRERRLGRTTMKVPSGSLPRALPGLWLSLDWPSRPAASGEPVQSGGGALGRLEHTCNSRLRGSRGPMAWFPLRSSSAPSSFSGPEAPGRRGFPLKNRPALTTEGVGPVPPEWMPACLKKRQARRAHMRANYRSCESIRSSAISRPMRWISSVAMPSSPR